MNYNVNSHLERLIKKTRRTIVIVRNSRAKKLSLQQGVEIVTAKLEEMRVLGGKLLIVGNGGSAAIASHQVADFFKQCGLRALTFLDHSLLTCMANDFGYHRVFSDPISIWAKREDILIAISSSGQSGNILNAVAAAKTNKAHVITLSGFEKDNELRETGDVNFYVNDDNYRIVETAHQIILDCILESFLKFPR